MSTDSVSPRRQGMIKDMNARKLCAGTQWGHIRSCRQFAAISEAIPGHGDIGGHSRFQLHLADSGARPIDTAPHDSGLPRQQHTSAR